MSEPDDLTTEVAPQHRFDTAALERYLAAHVEGFHGPMTLRQFKGGQSNPTFLVGAGGTRYVLRKKPGGVLLPSAHAVEREYRVIRALHGSAVPVARPFVLCEDAAVIGTPFYLMQHVAGRVLWDPTLPGFTPAERGALYDEMNRVVAALHAIDPATVGLSDYGRPGNYLERQIGRWGRQYETTRTGDNPAMERLIEWLPAHLPPSAAAEPARIIHGDLRLDNLIFDAREPKVLAVLDWELSTLGDALADFAYHMLTWHLRADEFRGMAGADLAALGIPGEAEYVARWCERTGRAPVAPEVWSFYLIYNLFRLAGILQGIAKRVEDGTAASAQARETGARARPVSELAWRMARERLGAG